MIVFESLDQFLNEDLGTLKPFSDAPKEWKDKFLRTTSYKGMGGEHSKVEELPPTADYKTLLKYFKEESLIIVIIKKDGKSEFMFERDPQTPSKFLGRKSSEEYSIKQKRREEEKKAIEIERLAKEKTNENINPPKADDINERRSRVPHYDSAEIGKMSVPEIQEWIKRQKTENPNSTYQIFFIFADPERGKKRKERLDIRNIEDPYTVNPGSTREATHSQSQRYDIFTEKKRAKLDKEMDRVLDDFKQQLMDNFDKSMEKVLYDIRRGYSWNLDVKTIGEALMKGVDMTELKKFTEAYDAIEPENYKKDSAEASKKLKKLGF
jgi:hypothetical protein